MYQMCDFVDRACDLAIHKHSVLAKIFAVLALMPQQLGTGVMNIANALFKKADAQATIPR